MSQSRAALSVELQTPSGCHVYLVSRATLSDEEPQGDCHACDQPLAQHAKQTSRLVPRDHVFVIDEKELEE